MLFFGKSEDIRRPGATFEMKAGKKGIERIKKTLHDYHF